MTPNPLKFYIIGIVLTIALIVVFLSFEVVNPGHRGVKVSLGNVSETVLDEGLYLKTPFVDTIVQMDVKTQKLEVKSASASKDLQMVTTTLALNYNLIPSQVGIIYQTIGREGVVRDTIITPAIEETVKSVTAKYDASELITKRGEVSTAITEGLKAKLQKSNISVTDTNIVNFSFSAEFDRAIEAKVTAQQRAIEAENKVREIEAQAQQLMAQAEGEASQIKQRAIAEAEGITAVTNALTPTYVQYELAKKWNGDVPKINGAGNSFLLDVGDILAQ